MGYIKIVLVTNQSVYLFVYLIPTTKSHLLTCSTSGVSRPIFGEFISSSLVVTFIIWEKFGKLLLASYTLRYEKYSIKLYFTFLTLPFLYQPLVGLGAHLKSCLSDKNYYSWAQTFPPTILIYRRGTLFIIIGVGFTSIIYY